ncbi:hypothetical protein BX616_001610 [Lobosporangium transversale]|uniref:GDP-fucose protein O-fucosyltransferase-domain-containing protein n=1 Tax=Lobosporangium transversale TaxID=64571 RepID=A0A1Y2H0Z1_9FUNG|nr:hypothetical protein BCR41DRAFT_346732 [Lobosporangium transversale]KAF9917228.1 hypothetical protein BX616_001610 [Lobosporangium transversale]ORZ27393.1 hypothetical protein BCR41DRAFT_346732 [Lobosporangium transversale]|eukprot:XP_021885120.1 hypothetical protein BCR41DRAFT_346732 [Lobosporangium transversale]
MSIFNRHRAMLGALLIFCIGSLLTMSVHHPVSTHISDNSSSSGSSSSSSSNIKENIGWTVVKSPSGSSSSSLHDPIQEDKLGTGAPGTDLENNSELDKAPIDYSSMSVDALKRLLRGTIMETTENLLDPDRPIRPRSPDYPSRPQLSQEEEAIEEELQQESEIDYEEGELEQSDSSTGDEGQEEYLEETEEDQGEVADGIEEGLEDGITDDTDSLQDEEEAELESAIPDPQYEGSDPKSTNEKHLLSDFDVNNVLSSTDSYLLFIPSGKTIEAQFFSLITSLWIARHSNRTLIIPPPMMAPPSLNHIYPFFAGPKGRKRQRWSTLFDLRVISNLQPIVLIDNTRPVLQTPFTAEMAQEEETPTVNHQSVPYESPEDAVELDGTIDATTIKCHGPPTSSSWKALDFAGRHFLNRYNLVANFEVLDDSYWNLKPEAIQRNWQARLQSQPNSFDMDGRHQQLACISGADLIGMEDPAMEQMIWQEIGLQIPYAAGIRQLGFQSVAQALRGIEKDGKSRGYIGVHIDKLPSEESCRLKTTPSWASSCQWTVNQIAKRIALLQRTEAGPRPVVVTTTETDPDVLTRIDQQPGWFRISEEDNVDGLFDMSNDDLGGYAAAVARSHVIANSAVFVGSRESATSVHVAFRIKNEGRFKQTIPRWELY